jgi:hypothetical protein
MKRLEECRLPEGVIMNWKYHIPHVWDDERSPWEDFYLLPCDPNYSGESIWLTINVLGDGSEKGCFRGKEFERFVALMEGKEYISYGEANMAVRGMAFTKEEFLKWVKVWLTDKGFEVDELTEAPIEDFAGTNQHACVVAECRAMKAELDSLGPSKRYKRLVRLESLGCLRDPKREKL